MRKSELKVGVEYAVHLQPVRGERSPGPPLKATLVEIDGTISETLMVVASVRRSWSSFKRYDDGLEIPTNVRSTGLIVDLAEPIVQGEVSSSGKYVDLHNRGQKHVLTGLLGYNPVEEYEDDEWDPKDHKRPVTRVALENAGCFVQTWAEHLEAIETGKKIKVLRQRQAGEALLAARIEEPQVQARLEVLLDLFRAHGYEIDTSHWGVDGENTHCVSRYYARRPSESRYSGNSIQIDLKYHQHHGTPEKKHAALYPLVAVTVGSMSADQLLGLVGSLVTA